MINFVLGKLYDLIGLMIAILVLIALVHILTGYDVLQEGMHPYFRRLKKCMIQKNSRGQNDTLMYHLTPDFTLPKK